MKQNFQLQISALLNTPPVVSPGTLTNLRREGTERYTRNFHQNTNKTRKNYNRPVNET